MSTIIATSGNTGIEVAEKIVVAGGGQSAYILVTSTAGATLTCGQQTYTLGESETEHVFSVGLGTWTVTVSNNVIAKSKSVVVASYSVYKITVKPQRLPSEYQEVEYIKSDGNSWLITNYYPTKDVSYECKFQKDASSGTNNGLLTCKDNKGSYFNLWTHNNSTEFRPPLYSAYALTKDNTTVPLIVKFDPPYIYADGEQVYSNQIKPLDQDYPLWVFSYYNGDYRYTGKIFYATFKDNGVLSLSLIPCYRESDNEIGMYDLVTDTFFVNQGTGSFIAGPDVN